MISHQDTHIYLHKVSAIHYIRRRFMNPASIFALNEYTLMRPLPCIPPVSHVFTDTAVPTSRSSSLVS
jgi:hypothetical protein